jgi:diguanylate cyclase (GGDEF)-like protein
VRVFDRSDGARSRECNGGSQPAAARAADGRFWFPTLAGVVVFDPARQPVNPQPPTVRIERLLVDGAPLDPGAPARVPAGSRRIEAHFTAASLSAPARVRFRHRLAGYERDWMDVGTSRAAVYGRLPPGDYRLEVLARNEDGVEAAAPATLALRVLPRIHETALFRYGGAAALAALFALAYAARVRGLHRRERTLQALVASRTAELAATADRLREANHELERLSATDPLTGLANRRSFDLRLDEEWRRARRERATLAIAVLDVDCFKPYNDTYGHPAGDQGLREIARVVAAASRRAGETAARLGGEEFALLLPGADLDTAATLAEGVRAAVERLAIPHHASTAARVLTVSCGVAATVPSEPGAPAALVDRADQALYRAKRAGRNRVVAGA